MHLAREDAAGSPSIDIANKSVLGYTQANSRVDDQGRMQSQLTIDRFETEQTMNGAAQPSSGAADVIDQSLTAFFDRTGKLVDVTIPKELQRSSSLILQIVAATYGTVGFLPESPMAVGDTAEVNTDVPLRLPGSTPGSPYRTRTIVKLQAVLERGGDKIARIDQRIESAKDGQPMVLSGSGTIDVNVDKGFIAASSTEWTFNGRVPTGDATARSAQARGSMRLHVTAR